MGARGRVNVPPDVAPILATVVFTCQGQAMVGSIARRDREITGLVMDVY